MHIRFLEKTPHRKFHKLTGKATTIPNFSKHFDRTKLKMSLKRL